MSAIFQILSLLPNGFSVLQCAIRNPLLSLSLTSQSKTKWLVNHDRHLEFHIFFFFISTTKTKNALKERKRIEIRELQILIVVPHLLLGRMKVISTLFKFKNSFRLESVTFLKRFLLHTRCNYYVRSFHLLKLCSTYLFSASKWESIYCLFS